MHGSRTSSPGPCTTQEKQKGAKASALAQARADIEDGILDRLAAEAEKVDPGESSVAALDWLNGRRTPFADQTLKGAVVGLTLGTTAPKIFRALVEATAFGSRAIVEQFRKEGVPINAVIAQGGIARKSPFVMQVTADILGMPIRVVASDQACALGAGMLAAAAAEDLPVGARGAETDEQRVRQGLQAGPRHGVEVQRAVPPIHRAQHGPRAAPEETVRGDMKPRTKSSTTALKGTDAKRLQRLRQDVYKANMDLVARGLVVSTFGNVSGIDREMGLIAIKPSGVDYDELSPGDHGDPRPRREEGRWRPEPVLGHEDPRAAVPGVQRRSAAWCTRTRGMPRRGQRRKSPSPAWGQRTPTTFTARFPAPRSSPTSRSRKDYEEETAVQILDAFSKLDYRAMPAVLVASHGPFTWGKNAAEAGYHAWMLEFAAEMAVMAVMINPRIRGVRSPCWTSTT